MHTRLVVVATSFLDQRVSLGISSQVFAKKHGSLFVVMIWIPGLLVLFELASGIVLQIPVKKVVRDKLSKFEILAFCNYFCMILANTSDPTKIIYDKYGQKLQNNQDIEYRGKQPLANINQINLKTIKVKILCFALKNDKFALHLKHTINHNNLKIHYLFGNFENTA